MEAFHVLLEEVLAGADPQATPTFSQSVLALGTKLKETALRQQGTVRQLVEDGMQAGRYHRGNGQLLLLFLDAIASGAKRTLQLEKYLVGTDAPPPPTMRTPRSAFSNTLSGGRELFPCGGSLKGAFLLTKALQSAARRTLSGVKLRPDKGQLTAVRLLTALIVTAERRTESAALKQLTVHQSARASQARDAHWQWQQKARVVENFIRRGAARTEQLAFWRWKLNAKKAQRDPTPGAEALDDFVKARKRLVFALWRQGKEKARKRTEKLKAILRTLSTSSLFKQKSSLQRWHFTAEQLGKWPQRTQDLVKAAVLQLTLNTAKTKGSLQAVLLKWKTRLLDSSETVALAKPALFANSLEKASRYRLRSVLSSIVCRGPVQLYRGAVLRTALQTFRRFLRSNLINWRETAHESNIALKEEKVTKMLDVLARHLERKTRRCFRPPIIVKDADEILRRQIIRLFHKRDALLGTAILMWSSEVHKLKFQKRLAKLGVVFQRSTLGASQAFKRLSDLVQQHNFQTETKVDMKKAVRRIVGAAQGRPRSVLVGWKEAAGAKTATLNSSRVVKAVVALSSILAKKAQRAFHPPKDLATGLRLRIAIEAAGRKRLATAFRRITTVVPASEAFRKLHLTYLHSVQQVINHWKTVTSREGESRLQVKAAALTSALERLARKNLRTGLLSTVKLPSQVGWKLQRALAVLPRPLFKAALLKIRGTRDLAKSRLRALLNGARQRFRETVLLWKRLSTHRKAGELSSVTKYQKLARMLKDGLDKTAKRQLRTAADRLLADHTKAKAAIATLVKEVIKAEKLGFQKWRGTAESAKQKIAEAKVKGQKLKAVLGVASLPTLREATARLVSAGVRTKTAVHRLIQHISKRQHPALARWKAYSAAASTGKLQSETKVWRLAATLTRCVVLAMRNPWGRVTADHAVLRGALRGLARAVQRGERTAVVAWRAQIAAGKESAAKNTLRGLRAKEVLGTVVGHRLKAAFVRCVSRHDRVKKALRALSIRVVESQKRLFAQWKTAGVVKTSKLQERRLHGEKLQISLAKVAQKVLRATLPTPKRTERLLLPEAQRLNFILHHLPRRIIRGVFGRITSNESHLRTRVAEMFRIILAAPRVALKKWQEFAQAARDRSLEGSLRSRQLRIRLASIPTSRLNEAFRKVVDGPSRVKAALQTLVRIAHQEARLGVSMWWKKTTSMRERRLFGSSVSNKLQYLLLRVPVRLIKSVYTTVTSRPRNTKIALRAVIRTLLCGPKTAMSRWRAYAWDRKQTSILKALTAQRLRNALSKVPSQRLNSVFKLIKGDYRRVKTAVSLLVGRLEGSLTRGLRQWRLRVEGRKVRLVLVVLKGEKMNSLMRRAAAGRLQFALGRVVGGRQKMGMALRGMMTVIRKNVGVAVRKWRQAVTSHKEDELRASVKGQKLRLSLEALTRQRETAAWERLRFPSEQERALRCLTRVFRQTHRLAMSVWRQGALRVDTGRLFLEKRAQQLHRACSSAALQRCKPAFGRLVSGGALVKAALRSFVGSLSTTQRLCFQQWKEVLLASPFKIEAKETPRKKASLPNRTK